MLKNWSWCVFIVINETAVSTARGLGVSKINFVACLKLPRSVVMIQGGCDAREQ